MVERWVSKEGVVPKRPPVGGCGVCVWGGGGRHWLIVTTRKNQHVGKRRGGGVGRQDPEVAGRMCVDHLKIYHAHGHHLQKVHADAQGTKVHAVLTCKHKKADHRHWGTARTG